MICTHVISRQQSANLIQLRDQPIPELDDPPIKQREVERHDVEHLGRLRVVLEGGSGAGSVPG